MNSLFNFDTQLLLQAFGIIFIGIGVVVRLGLWKQWYWRSKTSVYAYIPLGIIFFMVSFNDLAREQLGVNFWVYQACYAVPVALGVWWVARTPTFVKPDWVRWVEAYPPRIYEAMQQAALKDAEWERHVTSQKEVEAWAKSLERTKLRPKAGSKTTK